MDFDIHKVAELARLNLDPEEAQKIGKAIGSVLEYVRKLESLDTQNVPPTSHVLDLENVFRPDTDRDCGASEKALPFAPSREGDFFKVPKVVDKE
ncbi:MAG: Asp-tRNA(Asn)/Glu-tRNA(Gln) amidotransferase subunit GatC [Candidatus Omnitrophota bacterium]|jgi:aspartyl-tRNA(Asn)/glutamyl-tRNA(Gln) amidotransferase subunit C